MRTSILASFTFPLLSLVIHGCGDDGACRGARCDDAGAGTTVWTTLTTSMGDASSTSESETGDEAEGSGTGTSSDSTSSGDDTTSSSSTDDEGDTSTSGDTTSTSDTSTSTTTTSTTTSTTSTTTDADTGGSETGPNCGEADFEFTPTPANVVLVLDKSGSMLEEWDYNGANVTRWFTLYDVVEQMVMALDADVNFGMKLYPSASITDSGAGNACQVDALEVPVAPMNATNVMAAMPANDAEVAGRTPTRVGFTFAIDHLKTLDPINPPVVVLVTDGEANCAEGGGNGYDDALNGVVEDAFLTDEIPTYVVGVDIDPNQDFYAELNDVAVKGGVPKTDPNNPNERFYNATDGAALQAVIEEISGSLQSCVVPLDPAPTNPTLVTIRVGGIEVPVVTDCATENGWQYVNPAGPYNEIQLCGTACDDLKVTGNLDATYGCPPPV